MDNFGGRLKIYNKMLQQEILIIEKDLGIFINKLKKHVR